MEKKKLYARSKYWKNPPLGLKILMGFFLSLQSSYSFLRLLLLLHFHGLLEQRNDHWMVCYLGFVVTNIYSYFASLDLIKLKIIMFCSSRSALTLSSKPSPNKKSSSKKMWRRKKVWTETVLRANMTLRLTKNTSIPVNSRKMLFLRNIYLRCFCVHNNYFVILVRFGPCAGEASCISRWRRLLWLNRSTLSTLRASE